jgi:glycosyltransferase involved in cell wall biosynthesis
MKVAASLGWYFPQSTGGTEVYVSGLYSHLQQQGVTVSISASLDGSTEDRYIYQGIPVYRYPVLPERNQAQTFGIRPHGGFEKFKQWLHDEQADIYHQHSWTYGCGLHHLRAARDLGIPTVLTVHVPGPVCLRGTMLFEGREPCDGVISRQRCANCWLHERGLAPAARPLLSRLPAGIGRRARSLGRIGTALAATDLVVRHLDSLLAAAETADRIVAVCQWLFDALLANGVPQHKLVLNRQGVNATETLPPKPARQPGPLRLGYLGRWDPAKGIDKLIQAVVGLPASVPLELQIRAVEPQDPTMRTYMLDTCRAAAADPRIRMLGPLPAEEVPHFLRSLDVLAVPSQGFETGPLVVLESFAAGTPVIGSDLGGIRELVRTGQDGQLVAHDDVEAWRETISLMAQSTEMVERLTSGVHEPRTMHDASIEMHQMYYQLFQ